MLPGPGGLTTDSGKSDTFTEHRLNNEIMNASLKGHFGENKAESFFYLFKLGSDILWKWKTVSWASSRENHVLY